MIRSAVTISLVDEARGGPFVFWDDWQAACRAAKELGFDAVEIFAPGPEAINVPAWRSVLGELGLSVAAVGTGAGWVKHKLHLALPDASARQRAQAFIRSIIDLGAQFNAPAIIGSMQGRHGDGVDAPTAQAWLIEGLNQLGAHAKSVGQTLIYEPLNRYETNQVNSVESGLRLLEKLAVDNVTLLSDLFHMNIEEVDIAAALRQAGRHVGHVHFVDSNRRAAGFGHMDYAPIAAALRDINYTGYASAEVLPLPDSLSAARQTIAAFRRWFR
ncbi:MAG: sugar phosphate isomerase/epimerase [Planctomycetaceae bacterium]|nr:sugar phosphate isomerase/epimerase [Planctomycetaceae bacterium]